MKRQNCLFLALVVVGVFAGLYEGPDTPTSFPCTDCETRLAETDDVDQWFELAKPDSVVWTLRLKEAGLFSGNENAFWLSFDDPMFGKILLYTVRGTDELWYDEMIRVLKARVAMDFHQCMLSDGFVENESVLRCMCQVYGCPDNRPDMFWFSKLFPDGVDDFLRSLTIAQAQTDNARH